MGDAVLQHSLSPAFDEAAHVLLIWGDIPFIQPATVEKLLAAHKAQDNDFTFATRYAQRAYTIVERDEAGGVKRVLETREAGIPPTSSRRARHRSVYFSKQCCGRRAEGRVAR